MCAIVDANMCGMIFGSPTHKDSKPLWTWIYSGGALVFGGKLKAELAQSQNAHSLLAQLKKAGRAFEQSDAQIQAASTAIKHKCTSNDLHVVALALSSGARVLVTEDKKLIADFKNAKVVTNPRGKVYKRAGNRNVLGHTSACPWSRTRG